MRVHSIFLHLMRSLSECPHFRVGSKQTVESPHPLFSAFAMQSRARVSTMRPQGEA